MSIRITAIHQDGGSGHQHITHVWWTDPATKNSGQSSRRQIVSWIETKRGTAYVEDARGNRANVGVVTPLHGEKFLRTYADKTWTDNLLILPKR